LTKTTSLVVSTAVPVIKSRNESQTSSILRDPKKELLSFEIVKKKNRIIKRLSERT
jgi:ERCC4-type nuclease